MAQPIEKSDQAKTHVQHADFHHLPGQVYSMAATIQLLEFPPAYLSRGGDPRQFIAQQRFLQLNGYVWLPRI